MKPWPVKSELLAETRITTPARTSFNRFGRMANTSPMVQKFTRRSLKDVPTVVGGSAERAPGISKLSLRLE